MGESGFHSRFIIEPSCWHLISNLRRSSVLNTRICLHSSHRFPNILTHPCMGWIILSLSKSTNFLSRAVLSGSYSKQSWMTKGTSSFGISSSIRIISTRKKARKLLEQRQEYFKMSVKVWHIKRLSVKVWHINTYTRVDSKSIRKWVLSFSRMLNHTRGIRLSWCRFSTQVFLFIIAKKKYVSKEKYLSKTKKSLVWKKKLKHWEKIS